MTRLLALLALAAASASAQAIPDTYKDLKFPPLNPIRIPRVDRSVLPNGMTLFLVEDKELPLVRARAIIRTGTRWEPIEKAGLASTTLRVMRTGGTPQRKGDDLDKELDRLAASVETFAGEDSSGASIFVLKEDAPKGLEILADILRNPAFPQDKIDLSKTATRAGIARRNDNAHGIHSREGARLLYGKNSPYTRQVEYATIDSISRDDLLAFHKQYFQPENVILGVWGDFDAKAMKDLVTRTLGAWPKGNQPRPQTPAVDKSAQATGAYLLNKDDVNQSNISISLLLGRRDDPDYHAMVVMSQILGGGFGSRLFNEVRTNAGLAYGVGAGYRAEYDHAGYWSASAGTKTETTMKALEMVRKEISKIRTEDVTADELQRAKDGLLKGEAFDYDSTSKIIGRLMDFEYYGYPSDFLARFRAGVEKVNIADVKRVAAKYLDESRFLTVILGKAAEFDKSSTDLKLTEVDYAIPPPKAAAVAAPTGETTAKGVALLTKARQAHGGDAVSNLKDYALKLDIARVGPQGEMTMQAEAVGTAAGKSLMKLVLPMGRIEQGFDGNIVWMRSPQGVQVAPAAMAERARQSNLREILTLLRNFDQPGYSAQALGASKLGGKDVEGVLVSNAALKLETKLFVDPATGLLAGKSYMDEGGMGSPPGERVETFSDIRDVQGVKMPFLVVVTTGGQKSGQQTIKEAKINQGVNDDAFQKPSN
ncbi:MAG: pitrilysin family protein [Bryobacteraceae bacterium]